jgi:hypothetical protein
MIHLGNISYKDPLLKNKWLSVHTKKTFDVGSVYSFAFLFYIRTNEISK